MYIDILPDFIGYFMIVSALGYLQPFSISFSKAKIMAVFLAIVSIPAMFLGEVNLLNGFNPSAFTISFLVVSTILGLLHIATIYHMIRGLIDIAERQ